MKNYSFEQLPYILVKIEERLDKIEDILLGKYQKDSLENDFIGAKEA